MSGTVAPERSSAPEWGRWLTLTVLMLAAVLLVGLISLANGASTVFLIGIVVFLVLSVFVLPAWAVYGMDKTKPDH